MNIFSCSESNNWQIKESLECDISQRLLAKNYRSASSLSLVCDDFLVHETIARNWNSSECELRKKGPFTLQKSFHNRQINIEIHAEIRLFHLDNSKSNSGEY